MAVLKRIFDFYLEASIHVALSCYALVRITQQQFDLGQNHAVSGFVFFGTIVGYNFVKYDALARTGQLPIRKQLKSIIALSLLSFLAVGFFFLKLRTTTQLVAVAALALTALYTLPFFPDRSNARNWKGIKIYIVSFCWVVVTVMLPVLDSGALISSNVFLECMRRFVLIFVLVLIFEIGDLKTDDPNLQTVPQQIGVRNTKILGGVLLLLFYLLLILKSNVEQKVFIINAVLAAVIGGFLYFSNKNRSKYYTAFWAESVPVFWWLMLMVCS